LDEVGRRAWTVEEMTKALELFEALIDRGLTSADAARMSRTRLAAFWNRQASLIAPVSPWLLRHLLESADTGEDGGAAVPPPSVGGERRVPAIVGGYVVFRREPYEGDDHTKAAMLLA